jgi:poly-gamma-glutamate synthesis protein (capsule biosynthesis protein)
VKNYFWGSPDFALFLREIGVQLVSIANNHILEHDTNGLRETLAALEKNGIEAVGLSADNTSNVVIKSINDMRIGVAGFNSIGNFHDVDIIANLSEDAVARAINIMTQKNADLKILSLHWGDEFVNTPSPQQIDQAHRFIELGADIIMGHHPHVIQPVEIYKGKVIIYSLGNFIFDMRWSKSLINSIAVRVKCKGKSIRGIQIVPFLITKEYLPLKNIGSSKYYNNAFKRMHKELREKNVLKFHAKRMKYILLFHRILMKLWLILNWGKISLETKNLLIHRFFNKLKASFS